MAQFSIIIKKGLFPIFPKLPFEKAAACYQRETSVSDEDGSWTI